MIVGLAAMLVACAAISASASAANNWKINGAALTGTAAVAPTAAAVTNQTITIGGNATVRCTGNNITINGGQLIAPNMGSFNNITMNNCTVINGNCNLVGNTINLLRLNIAATKSGGMSDRDTFTPKTKTLLATIGFTGTECAIAGEVQPMTGKFTDNGANEQTESTNQEFSVLSSELKVGSSTATYEGSMKLDLASSPDWSFS